MTGADAAAAANDHGLDPVDRDALQRCVDRLRGDPELGSLVEEKIADGEEWIAVAKWCAFAAQMHALNLKPWQPPPCWGGDPDSDALIARLRRAGLSRFEPDPAAALAAKEKPKRK